LAAKVVRVGNSHGSDIDRFKAFGLTLLSARPVRPPLIAECLANLECRVVDTQLLREYDVFILEVLKAWVDAAQKKPKMIHHRGARSFSTAGQ